MSHSIRKLSSGFIFFILLCVFTSCSYKNRITGSDISVSPYFSSNMVFQKGQPVKLNGKCSSFGVVAIRIGNVLKYASANKEGAWEISFPSIDYSEAFSILIEGVDEEIVLENVTMGSLWVLIGDSWLNTDYRNFENKVSPGFNNEDVRYFQPQITFETSEDLYGEWKTLQRIRISSYEYFTQLLGDALNEHRNEPIGIINLIVPGLNVEDFKNTGNSAQDTLWRNFITAQRKYEFLADSSFRAIEKEVLDRRYDDGGWMELDFPIITDRKWFLKDRIAWWRKKIYVSEKYIKSDFTVDMGAIRGQFNFYFNGAEVATFKGETNSFKFTVPNSLIKVWTNLLTVRMVAGDSLSGFYSDKPRVTNVDSSFRVNIAEGWRLRTYLEPRLPNVTKPKGLKTPVLSSILNNLNSINLSGVIVAGGYGFYTTKHGTESIGTALKQIDTKFVAKDKYIYLIPIPGMADVIINSKKYNAARNAQLAASAPSHYQIINTLNILPEQKDVYFYNALISNFIKLDGE